MDDCLLVVHAVERTSFVAKVCLMELTITNTDCGVVRHSVFMIACQIVDNIPVSVSTAIVHNRRSIACNHMRVTCLQRKRMIPDIPSSKSRSFPKFVVPHNHLLVKRDHTAIVYNWIDIIQTVSAFVLRLQGSADFLIPDQVPTIKRHNVLSSVCARRTVMSRRKGSRNFRVYNIRNSVRATQYAFQRWGYFFAISDAASLGTLSAHEGSDIVADSMRLSSVCLTSV